MFYIGYLFLKRALRADRERVRIHKLVNYAILRAFKTDDNFHLVNDFYFIDKDDVLHQIDHILICEKGVFVIRDKKLAGEVYGDFSSNEWKCQYRRKTYSFINPLKSNLADIFHLEKLIGETIKIDSLVVFLQCDISNIGIGNVIRFEDIPTYFESLKTSQLLSKDQQNNILASILKSREDQKVFIQKRLQ